MNLPMFHEVLLVVNPISIIIMFPVLSLLWDRPLIAVPVATVAAVGLTEAYSHLLGASLTGPGPLSRIGLLLITAVALWGVTACVHSLLGGRRERPDAADEAPV